jgi:hypothetical protein
MTFDDEEPCATIKLDPLFSLHMIKLIERRKVFHQVSHNFREALSDRRNLPITFDDELARQRPNLEFVTARHPLALAAREYFEVASEEGFPVATIEVSGPPKESGSGYFFIYLQNVRSASSKVSLETFVVLDDGTLAPETAEGILSAFQDGRAQPSIVERDDEELLKALAKSDLLMASKRHEVEREARRRNEAILAARQAAVMNSFDARINRVEGAATKVIDKRLQRMYASQLDRLRAQRDNKLEELQLGREVDVSSSLLAGGRVLVKSHL